MKAKSRRQDCRWDHSGLQISEDLASAKRESKKGNNIQVNMQHRIKNRKKKKKRHIQVPWLLGEGSHNEISIWKRAGVGGLTDFGCITSSAFTLPCLCQSKQPILWINAPLEKKKKKKRKTETPKWNHARISLYSVLHAVGGLTHHSSQSWSQVEARRAWFWISSSWSELFGG